MKKICFFTGNMNRSGGTERVTSVLANALSKAKYTIYILNLENGLEPFFNINENIKIHSLGMENKNKKIYFFYIVKKIRNFLKNNKIDYIIGVDIISSIFLVPAVYNLNTKLIAWEQFNYMAKVGNFLQNFQRQVGRILSCRYAEYIVTLTYEDKKNYIKNLKNCKSKIITIYNPLTINFEKKLSFLNNKIVLAVGRLTYLKGFDLLIKSWNIISNYKRDWKLYIIGSGEEQQKLINLTKKYGLEDSVIFINTVSNIDKYFLQASIFVLSSRYEGFGLVLTEAKSFGIPIVSFDCPYGPSEIIRNNFDGFLVKNGDYKLLAKKILYLINNQEILEKFGHNAKKDNRFEINNIINQWKKILK